MGARGGKSAAAQETKPQTVLERLKPPTHLTPFQRKEWEAIVNRMPADWFQREHVGILVQYVRHMENAHNAARLINSIMSTKDADMTARLVASFDALCKVHDREGRAMANLATKMRLTQQSQYTHTRAANEAGKGKAAKPWDVKK